MIFTAEGKAPRLAYRVLASLSVAEGWEVMVDAQTGEVLQELSTIQGRRRPEGRLQIKVFSDRSSWNANSMYGKEGTGKPVFFLVRIFQNEILPSRQ